MGVHLAMRIAKPRKGVAVRVFDNQRGSVTSELSFGLMVVTMLVLAGLYMLTQIEGVSFAVLLHQLRHH
jgi:hypothetical protein